MKPIYLIPLLSIALSGQAQTTDKPENKAATITEDKAVEPAENNTAENTVYNVAGLQEKPEFPGGNDAFGKFVHDNFNPPTAADGPITVKAYVSFVVEKDGTVTDIRILKDPGYGVGAEAERVLKLSPKWKPGVQNGKPVRARFNLPLTLKLHPPAKPNFNRYKL